MRNIITDNAPVRLFVFQFGMHPLTGVPVPGYLIEMRDGSRILIDTGFPRPEDGSTRGPSWFRITQNDHVCNRLEGLGLAPKAIGTVICSHFDPDHCGANNLFSHAEFFVQRKHYEVAASGAHDRFEMQRRYWDLPELRYRMIDEDYEIAPGVELVESSGHVPGHQSVMVRLPVSGPVLLTIDAIACPAAADPAARKPHPFDMDHDAARKSAGKLQSLIRSEKVQTVIFGHDAAGWLNVKKSPGFYA